MIYNSITKVNSFVLTEGVEKFHKEILMLTYINSKVENFKEE